NLRCWTPQGHGEVDFAAALIHSCNYFYLSLFSGRRLADYENWLRQRFDWPARLAIRKAVNVYGFDLAGGIEPERLLRMYLELMHAAGTPNSPAAHILQALAGICRGTLADFCRALEKTPQFHLLWGKTGTVQSGSKPYGIVLVHLEHRPSQRKILLLCYEKNKTGSQVALRVPALLAEYERKSGKKGLAR
ncbi:MAG: penicillin-binding protein transpeptidase, partial [Leptospiraceae bacterium]|nr:penicillin-binding protein transpeptidase [Leptospiraceae bacterium]